MSNLNPHNDSARLGYQNRILTIIAVMLAVVVIQRTELMPGTSEAQAELLNASQVPAPPNAAAQRIKMIQELEKIDRRMDSIEKKLSAPFDVNVVSMPEVKVAD